MAASSKTKSASPYAYLGATVLGVLAGLINLKFEDLLLTALCVLCFTMLMGALYPFRPWRWTLLIALWLPLLEAIVYVSNHRHQSRAAIYESALGFVTGIAGAFGGALGRRAMHELWPGSHDPPAESPKPSPEPSPKPGPEPK